MLTFCPTCANLLLVDHSPYGGGLKLYCQTCPYMYNITKPIRSEVKIERKEVDDVLGRGLPHTLAVFFLLNFKPSCPRTSLKCGGGHLHSSKMNQFS